VYFAKLGQLQKRKESGQQRKKDEKNQHYGKGVLSGKAMALTGLR
jgi:hypothetical protein